MKIEWPAWLPAAMLAAILGVTALGLGHQHDGTGGAEIAATAVIPLAWLGWARGWYPSPVLALVWLPAVAVLGWGNSANLVWFALVLLAGQTGTTATPREAAIVAVACNALLVVQWLEVAEVREGWGAWMAGTVFAGAGGVAAQRQQRLVLDLQEAQSELAARAALAERSRIARELHDVIAHSLTVSMLHVTGARLAIENEPERAVEALEEAERLGRQSLADVRRTVGLLADGDNPAGDGRAAPLPGAADVAALVEEYRRAGLDIRFEVGGDPAAVPATAGLALYRIVQESLANAARHAPGAPVRVELRAAGARPSVRVVNDAPAGATPAEPGTGLGLRGMRERVETLGGTLEAGPSGDGWAVAAWLPA